MAHEYEKVFANIYEAVGQITLAKVIINLGFSKYGSDRLDIALSHLEKVAKDFPSEYEAAILAHPSRRQT